MKYDANNNGNLIYYDNTLGKTVICDPTMLFLLGLDKAINISDNTHLVFPKEMFLDNLNEYNKIKEYLLNLDRSSVIIDDESIIYQCKDTKVFLSSLDETHSIPIIKRSNDKNIDYSLTYKVIFDTQTNKEFYKILDYQILYSYSLGILFGYSITGYDNIWMVNPEKWENNNQLALLSEALSIFRFHYCSSIKLIDCDQKLKCKYKGIQLNKIWNFTDESLLEYPEGYSIFTYYDLESAIILFISDVDGSIYNDNISILDHGYTLTPSNRLDAYIEDDNKLLSYDLRYNSNEGYWSSEWMPLEWKPFIDDVDLYISSDSMKLYRGELMFYKDKTYHKLNDSSTYYICISNKEFLPDGIINVDQLYALGITDHKCKFILKDDLGNSLLDENNNPLVWYDNVAHKYWNGLFGINQWQNEKPISTNARLYDTIADHLINVADIYNESIIVNNITYTYSEFYNQQSLPDQTKGIIRSNNDVTKTFSPVIGYNDCYHDIYSDTYCVPGYMSKWSTQSDLFDLKWRFVNNILSVSVIDAIYGNQYECFHDSLTDTYCIPTVINEWLTEKELFDAGYRFTNNITTIDVFKPSVSSLPISCNCYEDNTGNIMYNITGYISEWVSKQEIIDDGWKFVDGLEDIYHGNDKVIIISDSYPED